MTEPTRNVINPRTLTNIVLFGAISDAMTAAGHKSEDGKTLTSKGATPDIKMFVNGIEVPFIASLEDKLTRYEAEFEQRAHDMAQDMLADTGIKQFISNFGELRREFSEKLKGLGYNVELRGDD